MPPALIENDFLRYDIELRHAKKLLGWIKLLVRFVGSVPTLCFRGPCSNPAIAKLFFGQDSVCVSLALIKNSFLHYDIELKVLEWFTNGLTRLEQCSYLGCPLGIGYNLLSSS